MSSTQSSGFGLALRSRVKGPSMTEQYKLRITEDVIKRLDEIARRYGRRSGNQVAAEIIEQYLDFWEQAEQAKVGVLEKQRSVLSAGGARAKQGPTTTANSATSTTAAASTQAAIEPVNLSYPEPVRVPVISSPRSAVRRRENKK